MNKSCGSLSLKFSNNISPAASEVKITTAIHLAATGLSVLFKKAMDVELPFAHNPNMSYHSLQLYTFHRSDLFSAKLFNNFTYPQNYFSFTEQQAIFRIILHTEKWVLSNNKAACLRPNPAKCSFCTQTVSLKSMSFLE